MEWQSRGKLLKKLTNLQSDKIKFVSNYFNINKKLKKICKWALIKKENFVIGAGPTGLVSSWKLSENKRSLFI